ncbi:hypothetical protein NDU88_002952 [Pleurodeles waltl]|uniref:Uncharacterized protein n=1 Tax=Pleurodeles waltl TaxID=8319 RepID=A0AAV7MQE0_PLEWA|nr:hypothetical protein NDU88_002952 [Pleurodeles waltl]
MPVIFPIDSQCTTPTARVLTPLTTAAAINSQAEDTAHHIIMTQQTATISGVVLTPSKAWPNQYTDDERLTIRDTEKINAPWNRNFKSSRCSSMPCSTWNTNADEDDEGKYSRLAHKGWRKEKESDIHTHNTHHPHTHHTHNQLQRKTSLTGPKS